MNYGVIYAFLSPLIALGQNPTSSWRSNFEPLGLFCYKNAKNPNLPVAEQHEFAHSGGCGCENTQFRWTNDEMFMMESHGHNCDPIFPGYNSTVDGDCTFFRIRNMATGIVVANVSESLYHSFFSAVVDYTTKPGKPTLWVFGPAHARGNKVKPGPCDGNGNWSGCYIGGWKSTDLIHWSAVAKAVPLPDHFASFNVRATMVPGGGGGIGSDEALHALPKHQAAMVIEPRSDYAFRNASFRYAINIGNDGDLSKNWKLLPGHLYSESGPGVPAQLNLGAPSMHYDAEEGYYYTIGGGSITAGPVRSKSLAAGTWEMSPLAPMSSPAAQLDAVGLPATDGATYRGFYTDVWAMETSEDRAENTAFLQNISKWNWGSTDPDFCCSDGKAPSYLLHTMSQQGMPSSQKNKKATQFASIERFNGTLNEWMRSYFPK